MFVPKQQQPIRTIQNLYFYNIILINELKHQIYKDTLLHVLGKKVSKALTDESNQLHAS